MHRAIRTSMGVIAVASFMLVAARAGAIEDLIEEVKKGCEKELTTYCKEVTPGEGRRLACLYAYGDKLSGRCEYALYDAAAQLERAVAALSYLAQECDDDVDKLCGSVQVGEGRLLKCLDANKEKVSARCTQAIKDVAAK